MNVVLDKLDAVRAGKPLSSNLEVGRLKLKSGVEDSQALEGSICIARRAADVQQADPCSQLRSQYISKLLEPSPARALLPRAFCATARCRPSR